MTLNALVRRFRITINSVDVTAAAAANEWFSLDSPKFSEDGTFEKTGTVTLIPVTGFAANFFNPRKNAAQWARGNSVLVELDFDGSFIPLFTGFILKKPPTPTSQNQSLAIPVGCELAYRDRDAVAGDKAGVTLGSSTARTTIIGNIWSGIGGSGTWSGTIADYPIPYNLPKHTGSYVQQMGDIAASAAYGLYCDASGNLQAAKFSLDPTVLITRTNSNSFLVPSDGSETPAEEVKVTVVGRTVEATPASQTIGPIIETGVLRIITGFGLTEPTITTGTKKQTTISVVYTNGFKTKTTTTRVETPFFAAGSTDYILLTREYQVVVETFSAAKDGKLLTRQTDTSQDRFFRGVTNGQQIRVDGTPILNTALVPIDRKIETWTYDGEVPSVYTLQDFDLLAQFSGSSYNMEYYLQRNLVESWTDLGSGNWQKIVEDEQQVFLGTNILSPVDGSGIFIGPEYAPREPKRHDPFNKSDEVSYTGSAFYDVIGAETEPALYEFGYGVSDAQAQELARIYGGFLHGRDQGWNCQIELTKDFVQNWTPASGATITLPDGDIVRFWIDGFNIRCSGGGAVVSFGLAEVGVVGANSVIPPYTEIVKNLQWGESGVFAISSAGIASGIGGGPSEWGEAGNFAIKQIPFGAQDLEWGESGAFAVENSGESPDSNLVLPISKGGTGAQTVDAARVNLGLAIAGGDLTGSYPNPLIASQYKPLTTKGDIYAYATAPTRLPVGTDGQVLTADSNEPSGLIWADSSGGGGSGELASIIATNNQQDLTFSSLTGLDNYRIILSCRLLGFSSSSVFLYINGDETNTNYRGSRRFESLTTTVADFPEIGFVYTAPTRWCAMWIDILRNPSNSVQFQCHAQLIGSGGNTDVEQYQSVIYHEVTTDTDINTLSIQTNTNYGFVAGTKATLYQV